MKKKITAKLPLEIFKEGRYYVAYCPALDLSTSALTLQEAKVMFHEALDLFFEEILRKKGSLEQVLLQCGWEKKRAQWQPPKRQFITELQQEVSIPCPA